MMTLQDSKIMLSCRIYTKSQGRPVLTIMVTTPTAVCSLLYLHEIPEFLVRVQCRARFSKPWPLFFQIYGL